MQLCIDGRTVIAQPGESLLDLIKQLGMDSQQLSSRPLAAKIAGEVFNLNYIPVRKQDVQHERASIRRAMAASKGEISLLRYTDPTGRDVYTRTTQFVVFLALRNLYPNVRAKMDCTLGKALFVEVRSPEFSAVALKEEVKRLVDMDIPLLRRRVATQDAIERYLTQGQQDKAKLLSCREQDYFDEYYYQDYSDYFYGELAPSTGFMQVWDILPAESGFFFLYPQDAYPDMVAQYEDMPRSFHVSMEGERWCALMECETVADLNDMTRSGKIRELIRVNEALHEKRFSHVADMICTRGARAVMLAGPSSAGKTTSGNRLAIQLRVHGKKPILLSMDDYYLDRDKIQPGPDGKLDLEHINTLDTELFRVHLEALLSGKSVERPIFNFKTGKREYHGEILQLSEDSVIIIEGLHALNPILLPKGLDKKLVFRLYVIPMLPLNLDDHNRIPSSLLRLLRRTVRDYEGRGASVQQTMEMWDSVRRGEKRWIFPFQENADMILNSSTLYELAVLKKHIYPLLRAVEPEDSCFETVRGLVKILNYVVEADVEDEIPPTSIVREFIGGNVFYK